MCLNQNSRVIWPLIRVGTKASSLSNLGLSIFDLALAYTVAEPWQIKGVDALNVTLFLELGPKHVHSSSLKELIEKIFFDPLNSNKMPVFICFVFSLNGISMWALLYFRELIFRSTFLDLFLKWNVEKPKQSLSKALSESLADLRIRLGDLSTTMSFSDFARCFVFRMSGYASAAFVCAACLPVWQYWKKLWCCFEGYPTCRNRRELINLNDQICWCLYRYRCHIC